MRPEISAVSEEIVRWGFEVRVNQGNSDWFIAFTNPTAGPWKRISAPNKDGKWGEVYRFDVDETRPDLILVSDALERILIIEAKPRIDELMNLVQIKKTSTMFSYLSKQLSKIENNAFWDKRSLYSFALGLLWAKSGEDLPSVSELCQAYVREISSEMSDVYCIAADFKGDQLEYEVFMGVSGIRIHLA